MHEATGELGAAQGAWDEALDLFTRLGSVEAGAVHAQLEAAPGPPPKG